MKYSSLISGDLSPVPSVPVPDTCADSFLCEEGLNVLIFIAAGTGFEREAVSDGQIDIAIESQGWLGLLLLRFRTPTQASYLSATFDVTNTPSNMSFARVRKQFSSSDGVALRIWTQDESGIIQTIRHTRLPVNLQNALMPIIKRQVKRGRAIELYGHVEMMRDFHQRTERTSLAFEQADTKGRVS